MAGKSNTHETDYLALVYNATPITLLAINHSSPAANISVHLHTADPTDTGIATTSEAIYTGYALVNVARTTGGWTVSSIGGVGTVVPVAAITFPACTGGTMAPITHFSTSLAGSTVILHSGPVTPNITVVNGTIPQLTTATKIEED